MVWRWGCESWCGGGAVSHGVEVGCESWCGGGAVSHGVEVGCESWLEVGCESWCGGGVWAMVSYAKLEEAQGGGSLPGPWTHLACSCLCL